jgi:hypothetical protein
VPNALRRRAAGSDSGYDSRELAVLKQMQSLHRTSVVSFSAGIKNAPLSKPARMESVRNATAWSQYRLNIPSNVCQDLCRAQRSIRKLQKLVLNGAKRMPKREDWTKRRRRRTLQQRQRIRPSLAILESIKQLCAHEPTDEG